MKKRPKKKYKAKIKEIPIVQSEKPIQDLPPIE